MDSESVNEWLDVDEVRSLAEALMVPLPVSGGDSPAADDGGSPEEFVGEGGRVINPPHLKSPQQIGHAPASPVSNTSDPVPIAPPVGAPAPIHGSQHKPTQPQPSRPSPLEAARLAKAPQALRPPSQLQAEPEELDLSPPQTSSAFAGPSKGPDQEARLQAFGIWLKKEIPTYAFFICDRHGEVMIDEVGSEKLIKVARTLAHASTGAVGRFGDIRQTNSLHVKVGPDKMMEVIPRQCDFGLVVLGLIVRRPISPEAVASVSEALTKAFAKQ